MVKLAIHLVCFTYVTIFGYLPKIRSAKIMSFAIILFRIIPLIFCVMNAPCANLTQYVCSMCESYAICLLHVRILRNMLTVKYET